MKKTALFLLLAATMPTACIQDEAPNAEADILSITLPEGVAIENAPDYYRSYDSQTGKLVKTTDATNPDDYVTYYQLTDADKEYIYNLIVSYLHSPSLKDMWR